MSDNEEVSDNEYHFFVQAINHAATTFELAQMGEINPVEGARRDMYEIKNLPVFRATWDKNKVYQNADFVKFVDSCIAGIDLDKPLGKRPNLIHRITMKVWLTFLTILLRRSHLKEGAGYLGEKHPTKDAGNNA